MVFLKFPFSQILIWLIQVLEENRNWEKEDKMSLSIKHFQLICLGFWFYKVIVWWFQSLTVLALPERMQTNTSLTGKYKERKKYLT